MNILFIGKRFYTNRDALLDKYGRIYQLPWHWSQTGMVSRLWLIDYHTKEFIQTTHNTLEIISTPIRKGTLLRQYVKESKPDKKSSRPDIIIASGDCYIGLMAYRLAKKLKAKFIFDVYDKYDEFGAYRRLPGFDPFYFLIKKADMCLFASQVLLEKIGKGGNKDILVPNGIDLNHFRPLDMNASKERLGLRKDKIYIGYFGTLNQDRGIHDLLAAYKIIKESNHEFELLIAGSNCENLDLNINGVNYLGNISYTEVPYLLACCNVLTLPYRRSDYLDMASSCKISEYLSAERPIVATRTPNLLENYKEQAAQLKSVLASPGDPVSLAQNIIIQEQEGTLVDLPSGITWKDISQITEKHITQNI